MKMMVVNHMHKRSMTLYEMCATAGYLGFIPLMPGTIASAATVLGVAALRYYGMNTMQLTVLLSLLFFIGCYAADVVSENYKKKDPSFIVIDEVVAMGLLSVIIGGGLLMQALALLLFRFFDIIKPFPINVLDQRCCGGFGIMIDDIGAAGFAWMVCFFMRLIVL